MFRMVNLLQFLLFVLIFSVFFFPSLLYAQTTSPWSLYNNPLQSNSLDFYLSGVSANPVLRLKSSDNSTQVRKLVDIDDPNNYYLDPNGSSVLANLKLKNSDIDSFLTANGSEWRIIAPNETSTGYGVGPGGMGFYKDQGANQQYYVMMRGGNIYLAGINDWITNYVNQPVRTDSNVRFNTVSSGSITLPNSGTVINMPEFTAGTGWSGTTGNGDGYMADGVPYYFGIGREPGVWGCSCAGSTYPDLVVQNWTGVRLAAHGAYGGVSIFDNYNPSNGGTSSSGFEVARFRSATYGGTNINTTLSVGGQVNATGQVQTNEFLRINNGANDTGGLYFNNYGVGLTARVCQFGAVWCLASYNNLAVTLPKIWDQNDNNFYVDPNNTTQLNVLQANSLLVPTITAPGASYFHVIYDNDNIGYYMDPSAASNFNDLRSQVGYNYGYVYSHYNGSYQIRIGELWGYPGVYAQYNHMFFGTSGGRNFYFASDNLQQAIIRGYDGQIWMSYCNCYVSSYSDARLKKDVKPIDNSLEKILKLNGVYYLYDKTKYPKQTDGYPDTQQIGFLAQQVQPVVPEVVNKSKDGFLSVDYAKLTALLTEGIKAVQNEILGIDKRLDQKDQEIKTLQDQLNQFSGTKDQVKAQQAEIDELKKEVQALKQR